MTQPTRIASLLALVTLLGGCMVAADKAPPPDLTAGKADGDLEVVERDDFAWEAPLDAEIAAGIGHGWTFTLAGPAEVSFVTAGGEFSVDTILYLHAGDAELAVDDDGGEGYYSALDVALEAGTYRVTVAGYGDAAGPVTVTGACAGEGCGGAGEPADPWALARDVSLHHVEFTDATPIPESFERMQNTAPARLGTPEWWQRWSGGATQSFNWAEGTDYGKRCGQASAIRLQAIVEYEEVAEDGTVTRPGYEAFQRLADGSGWSGTMYNWTEDVSEGGRPIFSPATMWAWRTTAIKWVNVVHPDGSCDLPTLELVESFSERCLEQAARDDGSIQGCRVSAQ